MRRGPILALLVLGAAPTAAAGQAITVDAFTSSDADKTEVARFGANVDWRREGPDRHQGVRVETARFSPLGQKTTEDIRVYYRQADVAGDWTWKAQVGTDGDTVLGALNAHNNARWRQEYFVEREIIETPQGLARGVYYTFAGAALDLPIDARNTLTAVGAVQAFTGRNERLHLRASYVHVVQPEWGLTAQLRSRWFHSSDPGEYDYFSPRNFIQVTPTLQIRRRTHGWRYVVAAGLGAQKQTGGKWRAARTVSGQLTSPPAQHGWALDAAFAYSNTPVGAGYTYDYRQFSFGLTRAF
ncbi:hypothetical protein [Phenylobacterium kunshanense]|uniref:DUF2490 domain-containing protein n=1 Tax=Phenylobacterium kunshanense TaxID=1445034 RepID=A0A328BNW2_9CAUL|nr:hypothetical protein [Phenylobacterium kunshanense]RAK69042.1 hypothetical protein DJ019_03260 [Phenylobacterium kunshanense]